MADLVAEFYTGLRLHYAVVHRLYAVADAALLELARLEDRGDASPVALSRCNPWPFIALVRDAYGFAASQKIPLSLAEEVEAWVCDLLRRRASMTDLRSAWAASKFPGLFLFHVQLRRIPSDEERQAWETGSVDFARGDWRDANPFGGVGRLSDAWSLGWQHASRVRWYGKSRPRGAR
jgi:hypothetical protein